MKTKRFKDKWYIADPYQVNNTHPTCFNDEPMYGKTFTERQQAIIDGEYIADLRRNEITTVIRKAEQLELYDIAEEVSSMYSYLFNPYYEPPSQAEVQAAMDILDSLKPDDL